MKIIPQQTRQSKFSENVDKNLQINQLGQINVPLRELSTNIENQKYSTMQISFQQNENLLFEKAMINQQVKKVNGRSLSSNFGAFNKENFNSLNLVTKRNQQLMQDGKNLHLKKATISLPEQGSKILIEVNENSSLQQQKPVTAKFDRNDVFDFKQFASQLGNVQIHINKHKKEETTKTSQIADNENMPFKNIKLPSIQQQQQQKPQQQLFNDHIQQYEPKIIQYLQNQEDRYKINSQYMQTVQNDLSENMRAILIDWLIDVQIKYNLQEFTLFLTIQLIDRYLQIVQVNRYQLQLIGVTCMFIASKYQEIFPPSSNEFVKVTDFAFTKAQVLETEGQIMNSLDFQVDAPTSLSFFDCFSKSAQLSEKQKHLCAYILELSLLDIKMLQYKNSHLAAGAVYIVMKLFKQQYVWETKMALYTQCDEGEVKSIAKAMCGLIQINQNIDLGKVSPRNGRLLTATKRKYNTAKHMFISKIQLQACQSSSQSTANNGQVKISNNQQ